MPVSKGINVDETVILKIRNKAEETSGVLKETRIPHHVKHTSKDSEVRVKIPHDQTSEMTENQDKHKQLASLKITRSKDSEFVDATQNNEPENQLATRQKEDKNFLKQS